MITELTEYQNKRLVEYREKYFHQAISTESANKPRAEVAAVELAEIAGVKIKTITWVDSPKSGTQAYSDIMSSILNSLSKSLNNSLWDSFRNSFNDLFNISLKDSLWNFFRDSFNNSFSIWLWISLNNSLNNSLSNSFYVFFDSLSDLLNDSLWALLKDSGWIAYYTYIIDVLDIDCDEKTKQLLHLYNEIAASCFALWITTDSIILCERPTECVVKDGKLTSIKFRGEK